MKEKRNEQLVGTLTFAVVIAAGMFLWQGRYGFSLWDEGHLWYGAQRVLAGEIPILDFRAYDPGRYYWSAAWMTLWQNDGVLALRASTTLFLIPGLWAGLLLIPASKIRRSSFFYLALAGLILSAWIFPRQKLFDISVCLMLMASLAGVISNPSFRRCYLHGLVTGLAFFFGRNHGAYGVAGGVLAAAWLTTTADVRRHWLKRTACWIGGLITGGLPFVVLFLLVPGFFASFWESLLFTSQTVLPIPTPWPWTVDTASVSNGDAIRQVLIGIFFGSLVLIGAAGLLSLFLFGRKKRVHPALAASVLMTLPYAHHAFSRADISHLAQGIFPMLMIALVGLTFYPERIRWTGVFSLYAISLIVMLPAHPGWQGRRDSAWTERDIAGDRLTLPPSVASDVDMLERLIETNAPGSRSFVAVPYWPGAYALARRKAPLYDVYPLFERPEKFQQQEIDRIRQSNPGFVVLVDLPLDGMDRRRFDHTNPLIAEYIRSHFERLGSSSAARQVYLNRQ